MFEKEHSGEEVYISVYSKEINFISSVNFKQCTRLIPARKEFNFTKVKDSISILLLSRTSNCAVNIFQKYNIDINIKT